MEAELVNSNHLTSTLQRLLPAIGPAILISIGYMDPGKWAATIDGGARFGSDLVLPMLICNLVAILCQYLSAKVGIITRRDLAQICSDEYDKNTCMLLGVQTLLSVVALDLTMILGIAHGLHLLIGADLSTCVFLTAVDAALFPLFAILLEKSKVNFLRMCIGGCILLFYVLGVLISQPEVSLPVNGMLIKLSEESAFALMSLLGANVMPHYFYLHSSIALQHPEPQNVSKNALCHHHFFAILCIFSGIYLVNYVLMNSAANVFYSTGLVPLTFPDAMSLMEQVLRSPVAPFVFLVILYLTNLITALTWNLGGQVVLHDFLRLDIPSWLQHATIRIIAIVPALYCVWTSGVEGVYQLLIFTQVMVALLLPSSVIPLFRVASSRSIMGSHKMSQLLEFVALMLFMGMLGLKIIFVVEMIFGDSDWVGNLRWNMGSSSFVPYIVLLFTACSSFCFMLWLAATPLKSATQLDAQVWNWEVQNPIHETPTRREESFLKETTYNDEEQSVEKEEQLPMSRKSVETYPDRRIANVEHNLPEDIIESDQELLSASIEEIPSNSTFTNPPVYNQKEPVSAVESIPVSVPTKDNKVDDDSLLDAKTIKIESGDPVEKTVGVDGLQNEREDDEVDTWEAEESSKGALESISSVTSDGPPSFRSLSGKSDEGGNGTGSLSRLAGLGRAARRQLASALDEFWGHLFDLHGLATPDAKAKRLDLLLLDLKPAPPKLDTPVKELGAYFSSMGSRASDSIVSPSLCGSSKQLKMQSNVESSYGVQRGSSPLWSSHMQFLDAYAQGSGRNVVDSNERRYSSVRTLPSSESWESQPATVHGYQITSIINRLAKDRSNGSNGQMESSTALSASLGQNNYRESQAVALGQKLQNGLSTPQSSGFQRIAVSRNSPLQLQKAYCDVSSVYGDNSGVSGNAKKYHSLPDISGLSGPYRDLYMSDKSNQWGSSAGYGSSVGRKTLDPSFYPNTVSGLSHYSNIASAVGSGVRYSGVGSGAGGGPVGFNELTKGYGDSLSYSGSLWAKQPYEQFGVADKISGIGSGIGSRSNSTAQETTSPLDSEAQLLRSFRCCIVKLLKLEGSDWLFRHGDGADEDLIDRVAARERYLYEAETREMNHALQMGEPQYSYSDWKSGTASKNDDASTGNLMVSSVPHCGEDCVWKADLIISFGVWCIHRILDLSLMESRPELWGKYTYVLNRLQGVIDPAFSKPRTPMSPCFCLQIPPSAQFRSSPPVANGMLPPTAKPGRGKSTNAATVMDLIKDVEVAISYRKGRSGTAAGDVAFPKGKENLASVLKRYKRRLSNKPMGSK